MTGRTESGAQRATLPLLTCFCTAPRFATPWKFFLLLVSFFHIFPLVNFTLGLFKISKENQKPKKPSLSTRQVSDTFPLEKDWCPGIGLLKHLLWPSWSLYLSYMHSFPFIHALLSFQSVSKMWWFLWGRPRIKVVWNSPQASICSSARLPLLDPFHFSCWAREGGWQDRAVPADLPALKDLVPAPVISPFRLSAPVTLVFLLFWEQNEFFPASEPLCKPFLFLYSPSLDSSRRRRIKGLSLETTFLRRFSSIISSKVGLLCSSLSWPLASLMIPTTIC